VTWLYIVRKEWTLELRKKSILSGLLLYLFSIVFILYLTFSQGAIQPLVWSALFWITVLFTAINTIAKSFIAERRGIFIYFYYAVSARDFIIGKLAYNALLCTLMSAVGYGFFILFLEDPVQDHGIFLLTILLASLGFAFSLTLISSIAAKTNNSHVLMAVLSFPIIISVLLMAIKVTKNCLDGLGWEASNDELLILLAINSLVAALSYLLFPYIWRS
jgi:heme exporter protein B